MKIRKRHFNDALLVILSSYVVNYYGFDILSVRYCTVSLGIIMFGSIIYDLLKE